MKPAYKLLSTVLLTGAVFTSHARDEFGIQWQDWAANTFATAKMQNKLILINVGYEGCTACRFMEQNTFQNQAVIDLVNRHFIAIQVDSEARPDIGERYSDWAWPANAFMNPDAVQVLAFAGSRRPDSYITVLEQLIDGHAQGTLTADTAAPYGSSQKPATTSLTVLRDQVCVTQDNAFKNKTAGVFENAEPLRHLLLRHYLYGDVQVFEAGLATLNGITQQLDPVWGGVFYASFGNWSNVVKEKRLESQAAALQAYADGFKLTGDPAYRDAIKNVHRYLINFMRSKDGTFFASQQDRLTGSTQNIHIDDYYALGDKERREYGTPVTDHAVYTDMNGRIILGYVMAFEATGNQAYLDTAVTAAKVLLSKRQTDEGWLIQFIPGPAQLADQRIHVLVDEPVPYLRTQAHFGLALLGLHNATAEPRWARAAEQLAGAMFAKLEDAKIGGFFGAPDDGTPGRRKPLEDNAAAARFLYLLGVLIKNDTYKTGAEKILRATAYPEAVRREGRITGNLAMALETITAGYVEFSVVGDEGDSRTKQLLAAARRVYEPRKVVHIEPEGRYPKRPAPAMYICNDERCTVPIFDPTEVSAQAKGFTYAVSAPDKVASN